MSPRVNQGHAYESACQTLREMGYFGETDPEDFQQDYRVLSQTIHTAQKNHSCEFGGMIEPGKKYLKIVGLSLGEFEIIKTCVDVERDECVKCQDKWEEEREAYYRSAFDEVLIASLVE